MYTQSLPSFIWQGARHERTGQCRAIRPAGAGTADPKLAITDLIRSMEAEIEEYIAECIG
jgi:hypothetical protein